MGTCSGEGVFSRLRGVWRVCYRLRMVKTFAQLESEDIGALIRFESIDGYFIEGTLTGFGSGQVGDEAVQHKIHLYRGRRFLVAEDVEVEFVGEEDEAADDPAA